MAFNIDPNIPLQAGKVNFDPAAIIMQAQQGAAALDRHRFEMQRLREQFDAEKEARKQQKAMQMGIASDLAGIQAGTPAQYAPMTYQQQPRQGQMPNGMTGVLRSEQGQQMPQPQAFGEDLMNGNYQLGGGEVTQPAVAGRQPSYLEMLKIGYKNAAMNQDIESAFKFGNMIKQAEIAESEQNAPIGNPYPVYDTQGNFVGTRVMTKAGQEVAFGTQGTTTVKPDVITAKDKANQLFEKKKFDIQNAQKERELNQGQQKIEIERTKAGTELADNTIDPNAPWARVTNPKEREKLKATVAIADSKKLDDLRDAVTRGRAALRDMERFGELNRSVGTGGLNDKYNPITFNEKKQEMEAIEARLTPQMRPAGSGATSDFEGKMYGRGIPQTSKSGAANAAIRLTAAQALKVGEAELSFKENFLANNGYLPKDSQTKAFLMQMFPNGEAGKTNTTPTNASGGDWKVERVK